MQTQKKVPAFDRRSKLVNEADRKLRQIRALVFVVASAASLAASLSKGSNIFGYLAAAVWVLFIATVVFHRFIRTRSRRLEWRLQLEAKLQGLRNLIPSEELKWSVGSLSADSGPGDRAALRLIRDLDLIPSEQSRGGFAALFPFFLSTAGQRRFVELLTRPVGEMAELVRRQKAVQFWEKRPVLRRKILRISSTLETTLETESLKDVAQAPVAPERAWAWVWLVVGAQALFFALWVVAVSVATKWLGTLGLFMWLAAYAFVARKIDIFAAYPRSMSLGRNLRVLHETAQVLSRVSHHPEAQLQAFAGDRNPVSVLKQIERASGALGLRQNPILALLINFLFPWDLFWTVKFDQARRKVAGSLPTWLEGLANLETSIVLAEWNKAHGECWPEFVDLNTSAVLVDAKALAHPLLLKSKRVPNDLLVTRKGRNHLVTGSNMSGKSTFLRAIGLNLLLAHAGAKVTAKSFRLVPLRVESSMRPADSLADGFSSFYSEVSDLVEIVKLAEVESAVFYLIDEIFRGTNNRERRIGAEAVIRALAKTPAMGFVTTHDLDLATLEGVVDGLENHHFRDDVTDGLMTFSYEYRLGPCPSTNALKVMRTAGLPVPD